MDFAKGDRVAIQIKHSKLNPHVVDLFDGKIGIVRFVDCYGVCVIVDGGFQDALSPMDLHHSDGIFVRAIRRFLYAFRNF